MKQFLRNNKFVLSFYFLVVFTSICFLLAFDKTTIHVYLNQFVGNKLIDSFFFYVTYFGDGRIAPVVILVILVFNLRLGLCALLSLLAATGLSSVLKYCFFENVYRPGFVFEWYNHTPLKYVEDVSLNIGYSFPSGHSTQVFSIFMCLVFFTKNNVFKFIFLLLSLLTAFSRTYLSQHWLVDITAGSLIGTFFSFLFFYLLVVNNKLSKLNKSLIYKT